MKAAAGKQLVEVPDARAKALVHLVLAEIRKQVEAGGEPLRVPGLSVFRTKFIEREKDGVKTNVKRTLFRAVALKTT